MYDTPFQFIVMSDASIQSVADLAGKQVGIGPQGGTGGVYTPLVFKAIKISANFVTGSWTDLAVSPQRPQARRPVAVAGVPVPEVAELEKEGNTRNLAPTPSEMVAVRLALPEIAPSIIAAGTYPSLRRNYRTLGVYNFAVARADLPGDLAHAILQIKFRHLELTCNTIHPAAAETVPSNFARNTILPFHDGAARWYNNKATIGVVRGVDLARTRSSDVRFGSIASILAYPVTEFALRPLATGIADNAFVGSMPKADIAPYHSMTVSARKRNVSGTLELFPITRSHALRYP